MSTRKRVLLGAGATLAASACSAAGLAPALRRAEDIAQPLGSGGTGATPSPQPTLKTIASVTAYANPSNVTCYVTASGFYGKGCLQYVPTLYQYQHDCELAAGVAAAGNAFNLWHQIYANRALFTGVQWTALSAVWAEYTAGTIGAARVLLALFGIIFAVLTTAEGLFIIGAALLTGGSFWVLARCFPHG